eukprot:6193506-Pleurochrysis_carterae.AAC.5
MKPGLLLHSPPAAQLAQLASLSSQATSRNSCIAEAFAALTYGRGISMVAAAATVARKSMRSRSRQGCMLAIVGSPGAAVPSGVRVPHDTYLSGRR